MNHTPAMLIRAHESELAELPPASVRWQWSDVVDEHGNGDGLDKSVAMRLVRADLIEKTRDDGWYETSEKLDAYLMSKYGIELDRE